MSKPIVLLVDDDEDFLIVAQRAIGREAIDAEVRLIHSGVEALGALGLLGSPSAPPPNLVAAFVDLSMPMISGWELLRRIRSDSRLRDLPVVVISSSSRPEDVQRSYGLGANSYLVKHFDTTGPGRYLANAVRYWTELNRAPRPVAEEAR